jgi:hypothetical protein
MHASNRNIPRPEFLRISRPIPGVVLVSLDRYVVNKSGDPWLSYDGLSAPVNAFHQQSVFIKLAKLTDWFLILFTDLGKK